MTDPGDPGRRRQSVRPEERGSAVLGGRRKSVVINAARAMDLYVFATASAAQRGRDEHSSMRLRVPLREMGSSNERRAVSDRPGESAKLEQGGPWKTAEQAGIKVVAKSKIVTVSDAKAAKPPSVFTHITLQWRARHLMNAPTVSPTSPAAPSPWALPIHLLRWSCTSEMPQSRLLHSHRLDLRQLDNTAGPLPIGVATANSLRATWAPATHSS